MSRSARARRPGRKFRPAHSRLLRILLVASLVALALGAADATLAHAAGPAGGGWTVSADPFRLAFTDDGVVVAAEAPGAAGPGARLSYRRRDGQVHTLTRLLATTPTIDGASYTVATDEPDRTATVTVARTTTGLSVRMTLHPSADVKAVFEAFDAAGVAEHFLGGGERPQPLDLRDQALAIKTSYSCANTMPAPFFLSSAGYGVSLDSSRIAGLAFPGADPGSECAGGEEPPCPLAAGARVVQLCLKDDELAYHLFVGTPLQIVSTYARLVGLPQLPPPSQFALIKWRDLVTGPKDLFADVDRLRTLRIPIGWILLDNPWETNLCYGTMTFDPVRYPDPAQMIHELHERGVRFMLWISPLVRRQWCPAPAQFAANVLFDAGNAYTIDLSDPATLATFESELQRLIALGVDGFKGDRGYTDLETAPFAGGTGTELNNLYPLLYARGVAAAIRESGRAGTFATLFSAGAPGSSAILPGFWASDQLGTFGGLQDAIHDGLSAGVAGYPIWGSDIGGYGTVPPGLSAEVFVRWAQFAAVTPVFEVGGTGESATFWDFGEQTVDRFRRAAILHYELFPYLYALARTAHATGAPILRPLAVAYPGEPQAWQHDLEALVGDDLLAAPVTMPTPAGGALPLRVYLPPGTWVDLAAGVRHSGGRVVTRPTTLDELPLYLRAGAAIPFAARTPAIWRRPWPTDALRLPRRGGWLYAPSAGSVSARTPDFGRFSATVHGAHVALRLRRAPKEMQVALPGAGTPLAVTIDGRPVPRAASANALRRAPQGWMVVSRPFPAVVLKLAPRAGAARATLTLESAPF